MDKITKLMDERMNLLSACRAEADRHPVMDAEKRAEIDKRLADIEGLNKQIETEQRLLAMEADAKKRPGPSTMSAVAGATEDRSMDEFRNYLLTGDRRSLVTYNGESGGYIVAPQQMVNDIWRKMDELVFMKSLAEVYQVTNADSLGCPTIESGPADAEWTAEIGSIAEDTTLKFGKRELKPHQIAKEIKVSRKLLRSSVLPVDSIVSSEMARKFACTMEKGFLTGSGSAEALGLFTTSAAGLDAGRNMATDNTATEISADNLLRTQAHVRPPYQPGCVWVAHPDFFLRIALLKNGMSDYIWRPGLVAGVGDQLLGKPVYRSEFAPNTFTTGQLVAVYGNMKYYVIAEALSFGIQTLNELYAKTSEIGYIGRAEVDGMPKFAEAFARVTMG